MFHQDIDKTHPTIEAMAAFAVQGLTDAERTEISSFLDEVLSGKYTGGELKALWRRSEADVYFRDSKDVVALLTAMREKLSM